MFKKIALSLFVIAVFVIYSVHQRAESSASLQRLTNDKQKLDQAHNAPSNASSESVAFKDGSYTGSVADAFYGYIQVKATISGGKLTNIAFLQYPNDCSNSIMINDYAMPILKQQAIQAQSAQVDGVSGATDTSQAFVQSLQHALDEAKA